MASNWIDKRMGRTLSSNEWFEVHDAGAGVTITREPLGDDDVKSYLIEGSRDVAVLDTGMAVGDFAGLVATLSDKQPIVLHSHSHWDHIGDSHRFERVLIHPSEADDLRRGARFADYGAWFTPEFLAAFWGVLLGFPVLRLRGDYLAIVTLAFGEIIRLVLLNWQSLTGGPNGVTGIPRPTLFGIPLSAGDDGLAAMLGIEYSPTHRIVFLFYLILALALLTNWVTIRLRRLPIGRAWEALREDEIACRSLGINTVTTKLTAFAIGAMFGGFAGSFFAVRQGFVSPESFVFLESAIILAIVVLGGMGSLIGIAVAAVVMVGGTELLREMTFLKSVFGPDFTPELYRMLIFGLAMVVVMVWKPRGFVGSREPTAFLKERKAVSGSFTKEGHG